LLANPATFCGECARGDSGRFNNQKTFANSVTGIREFCMLHGKTGYFLNLYYNPG